MTEIEEIESDLRSCIAGLEERRTGQAADHRVRPDHDGAGLMDWVMFTKRTDGPKLVWLERALARVGIPSRRNGHSFHAPILEVPKDKLDAAWEILTPVDDVPDDDARFA